MGPGFPGPVGSLPSGPGRYQRGVKCGVGLALVPPHPVLELHIGLLSAVR